MDSIADSFVVSAASGDVVKVKYSLCCGISPNAVDVCGDSALKWQCMGIILR